MKDGTITEFIKKFVKIKESELYTDQYSGYNEVGDAVKNHEKN